MKSVSMEKKGWLMAGLVALLIALVIYLAGRWQERSRTAEIEDRLGTQVSTLTADRDQLQVDLVASQDQAALQRARSHLFETALDLERRNFGTANARLDEAARQLAEVEAEEHPGIANLRAEIAATDLRVASDLSAQRDRVLSFAARVDTIAAELVGPREP